VEEHKKTEEQLKVEEIFKKYNECLDESAPDRQKLVEQLWKLIRSWNRKYNIWLNTKYKSKLEGTTDIFTVEIFVVIKRFIEEEKDKVPKDADGFIRYFITSLDREKAKSTRNEAIVRLPKEKVADLKKLSEELEKLEKKKGRKPTESEVLRLVSKFFTLSEYNKLMNLKNIDSYEDRNTPVSADDSKDDFVNIFKKLITPDIVESALNKTQQRNKDVSRALFTAHIIYKIENYEKLIPVLDNEIVEAYKIDKIELPFYEIYWKYYPDPEARKQNAQSRASQLWDQFKDKLQTVIKEKYPDFTLTDL
jgi:molybdopterin converting factor small subunit